MSSKSHFFRRRSGGGFLLDTYPSEKAWSLRKLSSTATKCVKVRRSSDNSETDILLSDSGVIDGSSIVTVGGNLSTWKGSDILYVTKLYNQGSDGVSFDLTQSNTTKQPIIADAAGVFDYIDFYGGNYVLTASSVVTDLEGSLFSIWEDVNDSGAIVSISNAKNTNEWIEIFHFSNYTSPTSLTRLHRHTSGLSNILDGNTSINSGVKSLSNISSNGSRTLSSIDGGVPAAMNVIAGADDGDWLGNFSGVNVKTSIGARLRSPAFYGGGRFSENILFQTEKNIYDTNDIAINIKTFYGI